MFKKILISILAIPVFYGLMVVFTMGSKADTVPTIDFESPYTTGNINGQEGWTKTGGYDVEVASVASFTNASGFGFETQALRLSNAVTSGGFGDQTFSPALASPAGEAGESHFEASFDIGSTQSTQQPGLFLSVSPDDGNGSRMSYVGFEDVSDGIHVWFFDVTDAGPLGTVADFNGYDVATIDRTSSHTVKFVIDFVPGSANDVVKLYVDGSLVKTGTTWEDYYRYDPEQTGNGNQLFPISKLLFREGGTPATGTNGNGYLVDHVTLSSSTPVAEPVKVNVCHLENKKKGTSYHLINVSEDAVPAHLVHGDSLPGDKYPGDDTKKFSADCEVVDEWKYIETVTVHSNSSSPTTGTSNLENGKTYKLVASGEWTNVGKNVADAEYSGIPDWSNQQDGYDVNPYFLGPSEFDLEVDGLFVDWGSYNPTHEYEYMYSGNGAPASFLIFDGDSNSGPAAFNPGWYGDNSGSLTVMIYEMQ